jgi:hypothetical protein
MYALLTLRLSDSSPPPLTHTHTDCERRTELREHLRKKKFGNGYVSYNDTGRLYPPSDATNHDVTGRLNLFKLPFFCQLWPPFTEMIDRKRPLD